MLKRNLLYSLAAVALLSLFTVSTASAEMFTPGFKIRAGGFYAFIDSKISAIDPLLDDSIDIDFESDLGLDDTAFSPFLEMTYRFNDRHAVLINAIKEQQKVIDNQNTNYNNLLERVEALETNPTN